VTTTHDGKRFLKGAGITLLALLGGLAGGAWWFFETLTFDAAGPSDAQRLRAGVGLAVAAVVVLVAGFSMARAARAPAWSLVPVALVGIALTAAAAYELSL
jgi:hypothetical protein